MDSSTTTAKASTSSFDFLDLRAQFATIREEVLTAVNRVLESQHFILGPEVKQFEDDIAAKLRVRFAIGCASGTDALILALLAAGIGSGDEVITSPFSFVATAGSVDYVGAKPVFVDIDPNFNINPAKIAAAITSRTRAIMPVHLFGLPADLDPIIEIARSRKLLVIEDAAQAIGARWRDARAGSLGKAAAFSFYPSKNLSAYGDAGLTTTNDPDLAEHMRRLRNHGSPRRYLHEEMGWNCRLDAIQAAVLRVKLPHLETWNRQRAEHAATYDRLLTQSGLLSPTADSSLRMLVTLPHAHHVYHQYVIRAQRRDQLRQFLAERKIGTEIYYPIPLHLQPVFSYLGYREGDLPEAERAAREVLALPMFPELRQEEQQWVVESIAEFYS
jgi:dTDP-4-amino-4,6-dideoxygalactose transaminase